METALKQRLLGAAVLIALAVIFLPMIFSGKAPDVEPNRVSLDIPPPPGEELRTRVYDLTQDGMASSASIAATEPGEMPLVSPGSEVAEADAPAELIEPPVASPHEAEPRPEQPEPPASEPEPAEVKPPAKPADGAADAGLAGGFAVSLGVYAKQANADEMLARAKALGFKAYSERTKVDGKAAVGVRVGPFAGRAAAEAARLRLDGELAGVTPSLVALGAPVRSGQDAAGPGNWAVQLAAYRSRADADQLVGRARGAGFEAFIDEVDGPDGHWWRVRVGPRIERADAEQLARQIKSQLAIDGIVVSHP